MKIYRDDLLIGDRIELANSFGNKLVGLIGKKVLLDGEGLLLMGCPAIHCFFMKVPIDAVYLSKEMKVVGMETIQPWRLGRRFADTANVLELAEGITKNTIKVGDCLTLLY